VHGHAQRGELARNIRACITVHQVQAQTYTLAEHQRLVLLLREQA
jgi:hypothetical protein